MGGLSKALWKPLEKNLGQNISIKLRKAAPPIKTEYIFDI